MSVLVLHGVSSTDDLPRLGLGLASSYASATDVVFLDEFGNGRQIKGRLFNDRDIKVLDLDPVIGVLCECMEKIKRGWEEAHKDDPDTRDLGHSSAALWLFYWHEREGTMLPMIELARRGLGDRLRKEAQAFVDAEFGWKPTQAEEPADG